MCFSKNYVFFKPKPRIAKKDILVYKITDVKELNKHFHSLYYTNFYYEKGIPTEEIKLDPSFLPLSDIKSKMQIEEGYHSYNAG